MNYMLLSSRGLSSGSSMGILIFMFLIIGFLCLVTYVMNAVMLSNVAKAQGATNGFLGWIPIANSYLLIKLAGGNPLFLLLALGAVIPVIGTFLVLALIIYMYMMWYKLGETYVRDGFMIWFITGIFILPCMWVYICKISNGAKNQIGSSYNNYDNNNQYYN